MILLYREVKAREARALAVDSVERLKDNREANSISAVSKAKK